MNIYKIYYFKKYIKIKFSNIFQIQYSLQYLSQLQQAIWMAGSNIFYKFLNIFLFHQLFKNKKQPVLSQKKQ